MTLAVTGTPGTGKTTATEHLEAERGWDVLHLNAFVADSDLTVDRDEGRGTDVVDVDAVRDALADRETPVIESHLSHLLDVDRVVVLRCAPGTLQDRLEARGEPPESARENAESEALDVILAEAVDRHGADAVYEVDTTDRSPAAVAADLAAVHRGEREPNPGAVDHGEFLDP